MSRLFVERACFDLIVGLNDFPDTDSSLAELSAELERKIYEKLGMDAEEKEKEAQSAPANAEAADAEEAPKRQAAKPQKKAA